MTHVRKGMWPALLTLAVLAAWGPGARAGSDIDQQAVDRAHDFLKTEQRGRDVLSYVHFGAKYQGHAYKEMRYVTSNGKRVPGYFALVYTYDWDNNGQSDVAFLCDNKGNVYEVQVVRSSGFPFVSANLTVKVLGNTLIQAFKDKLTEADKKDLQTIVDNADAKAMLEWSLKFQQSLGR